MIEILLITAALAIFFGIIISLFSTEEKGLKSKITEILPNNNCGSCGYASCEEYAKALEKDITLIGKCPVGGKAMANNLSSLLNSENKFTGKTATIICSKGSLELGEYHGYKSCAAASLIKPFECKNFCLGYGDCAKVCEYRAITGEGENININPHKCVGCGKCEGACPLKIIKILEKGAIYVKCSGGDSKCKNRCIGCGLCVKSCPNNAITINKKLATINQDNCTRCGNCIDKCPKKVIKISQ